MFMLLVQNDRSYKYFFIASNYDKILNKEQKSFLQLVTSNESTSAFADKIVKLVEDAKRNTQWRKQFMDWEIEKAYSFDAGKKEGAQEKAIETATNMLKKKYPTSDISEITGLSLEQVLELQKQITVQA